MTTKSFTSDSVIISDEELKSLTNAISQRHGIDFSCYEPKSLKRRVVRAMSVLNFSSIADLWIKILKERDFIYPFMDEISVGLTSLFRDPVLWIRLKSLLNTKFSNSIELSLWHAGCSTGEEVYTMGIVLKESNFKNRVIARATDISMQSIETAKLGQYHYLKADEYNRNLIQYNFSSNLAMYSQIESKSINMNRELIRHVQFEYHNLITSAFGSNYDIIFCRNVMIYFDNQAKRILFEKFYNALKPGGLLIIGFYDAVVQLIDERKFKMLDVEAKIFQKI